MSTELGALQERSFAPATAATVSAFPAERRLTGQQLADYLDRRVFAVIGTGRPDGRPQTAMSSYFRRGAVFWLPMVGGSARERNLRHQPWLTMTVTEGDRVGHVIVIIEGIAAIVPPLAVPADVRSAVSGDWVEVWARLTPSRLFSYAAEGAPV
jgi:Pyridoxamine 5'-phosphate oxidase